MLTGYPSCGSSHDVGPTEHDTPCMLSAPNNRSFMQLWRSGPVGIHLGLVEGREEMPFHSAGNTSLSAF